jgi:hypothetical protein
MGLSSIFVIIPPPSGLAHRANDCLPAGVDVHVLDGNFLLLLPSIALQCLGLGREGSQQFHSEISVAVLLGYHVRPLQTAQRACRSEMRRNHLDCQHRFDFVVRPDLVNRREYSVDVLLPRPSTAPSGCRRDSQPAAPSDKTVATAALPRAIAAAIMSGNKMLRI